MPHLSIAAKLRLGQILIVVRNEPCLPQNASLRLHLLEIIQGALGCPESITSFSSVDTPMATVFRDLTLQIQVTRRDSTDYERYLASSRAARLLAIGLQRPSLEVINALFTVDGQLVHTWMVSAEEEPSFMELVGYVYQAVKIWGWPVSVSTGVWNAFRRWQWSTLWRPLVKFVLNRSVKIKCFTNFSS
jgi:hypothetical protein